MEKTLHKPLEMELEDWEYLPDNTLLDLDLDDAKTFISKEIVFTDYFREEPEPEPDPELRERSPEELIITQIKDDNDEGPPIQDFSISNVSLENKPMGKEFIDAEASSPRENFTLKEEEEEEKPIWEGFSITICRWRATGVGALCSAGIAATAAIFLRLLGEQRQKQLICHELNFLRFGVQNDGKRLTRVVEHAGRLNQAVAAVRGAPDMARPAHISFGGYYDSF